RAVRTSVGVLDASTLGKIDLCGPDAGVFLDRMYTNRMSNLAVGSIRYGLMLGLDGMVFDDGRGCGRGDGPVRGVAPDRVDRPARVLHERHRAVVGRGGRRATGS